MNPVAWRYRSVRAESWWWFVLAGTALMGLFALTAPGAAASIAFLLLGVASGVAVMAGVRLNRPSRPRPWLALGTGLGVWVLGDVVNELQGVEHVFPGAGDFLKLIGYPLLAFALFDLARGRRPHGDLGGTLASWTIAIGLGLVSFELLGRHADAEVDSSLVAGIVSIAYSLGDIVLFAGLVRLLVTPGAWTRSARLLLAALLFLIVGDNATLAFGLYANGSPPLLGLVTMSSYLCFGAAALHRSMRQITAVAAAGPRRLSPLRSLVGSAAVIVAPVTLIVQGALGARIDYWGLGLCSLALFFLVLARMLTVVREIETANQQRLELQDQLEFEANHDSLTLLPNRAHGVAITEAALLRAAEELTTTALLFIDLDGFKQVNDTLGHRAGDRVLRRVAERLRRSVRGEDAAMRLGGDEFVVLLQDQVDAQNALEVAERLVRAISEPINLGRDGNARVGASIGVALTVAGETDAETLLNEADLAAYRAKQNGRGRAQLFDSSMRAEVAAGAAIEEALVAALRGDELTVHYQPVIDTHSGEVEGYEALVRWDRPGVGLLLPGEFLPVAETSDLICDIDTWVLETATRQLATWTAEFETPDLVVRVNISSRHVALPRIVSDVRRALTLSGISPRQLALELSGAVLSAPATIQHLQELRTIGVTVSLGDFGGGFGPLAQLADLPVDSVKIDGRFLDVGSEMSSKLLHLMIQGAHAVGLSAVAQGVEHDAQLATLRSLDCESVQGFHLARPMPAEEAGRYHREQLVDRFSGLLP